MKKILIGLFLLLFTFSASYSQDLHKYSTQEVLNIVLNDPLSAINFHHYSSQEVLNLALDETNSALKADVEGISIDSDGRIIVDGLVVIDPTSLAGESLDEVDFATHAEWDVTNDLDDTGGNAEYTWSANQTSTLTQLQASLAIAGVADVYYKFTYTVAVTTTFDGDGAATITTAFALAAVSLDLTAGTNTVYFRSAAVPSDFIISVVSGTDTEGTFTIDDVTLKQISGGRVDIAGDLWVNGTDVIAAIAAGSDDQKIDVFAIAGDNVQLSLEDDGEATKTVDISTTTAVTANTAKVTDDDDGVDGIYGAGWNADTDSPEKDDVYDYMHVIDTDDDGDVDNLDAVALAAAIVELDPNALLTAGTDNIKDTHPDWGTGANQISAVDMPIADAGVIITATEVEGALQENRTAIDLNTAKNTNVPTELSIGTVGVNTVAITSDGGADDVTIPAALVGSAGLLTTAKWAEIVANNAKVTNTDDQKIDVFSGAGNTISVSLETDGEANKTLDISGFTAIAANTAKIVGTHPVATVYVPSSDQARLDDTAITIANTIVRVVGDGGAVLLDTAPSISDGAADGQMVIIQGTSDANTVTIADNTNCQLAGGVNMTLGKGDTIHLIWDSGDSDWYELNRSDN